jgi:fermentation-respiration switch protein FrsA (DUF1100 family)
MISGRIFALRTALEGWCLWGSNWTRFSTGRSTCRYGQHDLAGGKPKRNRSMVLMIEDTIEGIPAIHAAPEARMNHPLPTIFFFHGYRSSKELSSFFGYMLATAGFRVILPEAPMHGSRFDGDDAVRLGSFWDILKRSIDELPLYRNHYEAKGLIADGRVGVGGTSMGGFAALGCMARYNWIRAVASYMGSGYYLDLSRTLYPPLGTFNADTEVPHAKRMAPLATYDISHQLERLADRPLFVWHGERDDTVPFAESTRLQADLAARGLTANLEFMGDPVEGHKVPMHAASAGVKFFSSHL